MSKYIDADKLRKHIQDTHVDNWAKQELLDFITANEQEVEVIDALTGNTYVLSPASKTFEITSFFEYGDIDKIIIVKKKEE